MSNKTYDRLKTIALIMPIFITFVAAIGEIWGIPYIDKIVLTLSAINGFLGGLVKISNDRYKQLEIEDDPEEDELLLERDDE